MQALTLVIAPLTNVYFDRNCSNGLPTNAGKEIYLSLAYHFFSVNKIASQKHHQYMLCVL